MIDDCVIKGVTEIANTRIRKEYPLLGKHYCEYEVKVVCEACLDLTKLIQRNAIDNQLAVAAMVGAEFGNMITGVFNE